MVGLVCLEGEADEAIDGFEFAGFKLQVLGFWILKKMKIERESSGVDKSEKVGSWVRFYRREGKYGEFEN